MRKLYILIIILVVFLLPFSVNAKENNIVIDFTKYVVDYKNIDKNQQQALIYLTNIGEINLLNSVDINNIDLLSDNLYQNMDFMGYANKEGKILVLYNKDSNCFIIPFDVGYNDNITVNIDKNYNSLKGYDSVTLKFGEKKSNDKLLTINLIDDVLFEDLDRRELVAVKMLMEKGLIEEQDDFIYINNKGEKLFLYNNKQKKFVVERGLTYKDNIIYDLSKDDIVLLNEYLGINSNYKQIKMMFGNDSNKILNTPKTFNIIVFPLAVLCLSIIFMVHYIYKSRKENQDV